MLFKISFLRKGFPTPLEITTVRFFFSMHSEMFYEVVPLSEEFIAFIMQAPKDLHLLHSQRIFKLVHCELLCFRYDLIYFDFRHIEVFSLKYLDNCIFWDHRLYIIFLDFISIDLDAIFGLRKNQRSFKFNMRLLLWDRGRRSRQGGARYRADVIVNHV